MTRPSEIPSVPPLAPAAEPEAQAPRPLRLVLGLACLAVVLPALGALGLFEPLRDTAEAIRGSGWGWSLGFAATAAILCGLAVLPTHAISLIGGFVFGPILGAAAALVAVVVGAGIGWSLAGRLAGDRLRAVIGQTRTGRTLMAAMVDARGGRAVLAVTLARLPPQLPFALGNVVAATTGVRLAPLALGTAVGMLPRVAVVAWAGHELAVFDGREDARSLWIGLAGAAIGVLGLGWWSWRLLRRMRTPDA